MITLGVAVIGLGYLLVVATLTATRGGRVFPFAWEHPIGLYGLITVLVGTTLGLTVAPREMHMGEVGRILHVHVPAAWLAMLCFFVAGAGAVAYMLTSRRIWDSISEAAAEVGVVEAVLLLILGSIFARPTWGVWWSWDPRLTSTAVMTLSFVGVLLLRGIVRDPDRRAAWSSVATILSGVNIFIVYYSVNLWASLHQNQSEMGASSTIDNSMRWIMYFNAWALLFATVWFIAQRVRLAEARAEAELPEPLPEAVR